MDNQGGRWLRGIAWTVLGLVVVVAAAIGFFGFTSAGTAVILRLAAPMLQSDERKITITGAGPLLTGHLHVDRVALADQKGVYASVEGIDARWSPLALLSLKARIQSLSADHVEVARPPAPSTQTQSSSFSLQDLPVEVDLQHLSLPDVSLGAALVGTQETLAAEGSLKADRQGVAGSASVKDLGRTSASAAFDVNYDAAAETLTLDASAQEPKGGIIANLLQLPEKPALGFSIKGSGALTNWQGKATASVEGVPVVNLDASVRRANGGPFDVALKGGGAFDAILPPSLEPLFKGRTDIDLAVAADPAGVLSASRGKIETGTLAANLGGTLSTKGNNDFHADIVPSGDSAVFSLPAGGQTIGLDLKSLSASVTGSAEKAAIVVDAALKRLTATQGTVTDVALHAQSDAFNLQARQGVIDTTISVGGSQFQAEALDRLVKAPLKLTAPVTVSPETVRADFQLSSASVGGKGQVVYTIATSAIDSNLQLFAAPSALPPALASRLTDTVGISGKVSVADGAVTARDVTLKSGLVQASGHASLKDGAIDAAFEGTLPDLGKLSATAKGEGTFSLSAGGTLDAPSAKVSLSVPKAELSGKELDNFTANINAVLDKGAIAGDVKASGSIAGQGIDVAATMKQQPQGGTAIPDLEVKVGPNRINGALTLDDQFLPKGQLAFNLPDLSLLGAMAAQPLSGALKGSVSLTTPNGELAAHLDVAGDKVGYDTVNLLGVDVALDYAKGALSGKAQVDTLKSGTNSVEKATLDIARDGAKTNFSLDARYGGAPLTAKGALDTGGANPAVHLDNFAATVQNVPLKLSAPTDLSIANGAVNLNGLQVGLGSGAVRVSGTAGSRLDLQVKIDNLPARLANEFSPTLGADGAISGTASVTGKASDPSAQFSLRWPSASLAATRSAGVPPLTIQADGKYTGGALDINVTTSGGGLSAKAAGKVQLTGARSLALNVQGSAPLSLAQPFVADKGIALSGNAVFDLTANGPLTAPKFGGTVRLASAGAVLPRQNLNLTNITGTIALDGQTARINGLTAKIANGGTIAVSGSVGIASGSGYPADLAIKLTNAVYSDGDLVNAKLGGDLTLKGPLTGGAELAGTIRVAEAGITVPEKVPASLAEINLKHKNASAKIIEQADALKQEAPNGTSGTSTGIRLNVDVVAHNQVFVRGRGIDAELGGTLKVAGTTASPSVSGSFNMIRGRLEILGKRLDFSSGTIGFSGGLVPTLDLDATSSSNALSITVTVRGAANNPEIAFSSSPARPQDEVLAQLIFGRSLSSLSALQIAQLADAALQLAGGRSTSVFEKLRKGTGIDDLDVSTDSAGQAQVTAGKYINNRTYLQLQQGATSGSSKAIINLDVGKGVKLRGEADSGGGSAAGIFYEKEY